MILINWIFSSTLNGYSLNDVHTWEKKVIFNNIIILNKKYYYDYTSFTNTTLLHSLTVITSLLQCYYYYYLKYFYRKCQSVNRNFNKKKAFLPLSFTMVFFSFEIGIIFFNKSVFFFLIFYFI